MQFALLRPLLSSKLTVFFAIFLGLLLEWNINEAVLVSSYNGKKLTDVTDV